MIKIDFLELSLKNAERYSFFIINIYYRRYMVWFIVLHLVFILISN